MENSESLFLAFNINPNTVSNILKNPKVATKLSHLISISGKEEGSKTVGELLYFLSTKLPAVIDKCDKYLVDKITNGELAKKDQLEAAFTYLKKFDSHESINEEEFNHECGVGVVVSESEIQALID